jgi:O-antigen/teichoic acid export membrane protein
MLVFASRYLSIDDYATFRQTFLPYEILAPLLALGIPDTIYYLLPKRNDKLNLFIEALVIILFLNTIYGLFIILGGDGFLAQLFNNPKLKGTIIWSIIYSLVQLPIQLIISILIYEGKTKIIAILSSLSSILITLVIIYLSIAYQNHNYLIIARSLVPALFLVIFFLFTINVLRKNYLKGNEFIPNLISVIKVSGPYALASILGSISLYLDKVIVSSYSSTEEFGIYVNGATELPFIGVITGSVAVVLLGEMSQKINENDFSTALSLFKKAASKTALILFPMMIFFIYNANEFIVLLYSTKYQLSAIPFTIFLFLLPIRIVVFGSALIALGKTKSIFYRSAIELFINLILGIIMYHLLGIIGVAIATVIVTYVWSVPYNLIIIARAFNARIKQLFEYKTLMKIMLLSILASPIMIIFKITRLPDIISILLSFISYFSLIILSFNIYKLIEIKEMLNFTKNKLRN